MKHVLQSCVLWVCHLLLILLLAVTAGLAQSNPTPFSLATGSYSFTSWANTSPAGTYPANMVFHFTGSAAATASAASSGDYTCPYNLTARPRINGRGDDGFIEIQKKVGNLTLV